MTSTRYLDTLNTWGAVARIPEQLASLIDDMTTVSTPPGVRTVSVHGDGPAQTVAQAVAAHLALGGGVAAVAGSSESLPAWIGPDCLVLSIDLGAERRATSGLAAAARACGAAAWEVGPPRAAAQQGADVITLGLPAEGANDASVAVAVAAVLLALSRAGLTPDVTESFRGAAAALARRRDVLVGEASPAEALARGIGRTLPLVYGAGLNAVAARHWKSQFNLRVKTPAFWGVLSDVAHEEVSGWGQHGDITRQVLSLVPLRHRGETAEVAGQFDRVLAATDEVMAEVLAVWAEGDDALGRFLDLVVLGDYVALYLAGHEGIDPGPVATGDVSADPS